MHWHKELIKLFQNDIKNNTFLWKKWIIWDKHRITITDINKYLRKWVEELKRRKPDLRIEMPKKIEVLYDIEFLVIKNVYIDLKYKIIIIVDNKYYKYINYIQ